MATASESGCLVQRQRQANHQRMDDEVLFITEGLKANSSTVLQSALHSLQLFRSEAQRDEMLEAGVYADLLTSMSEVNSTGGLPGDTAALTTLLGAHVFMIHCNVVSSKGSSGQKAALTHVRMATLTKLLASMLSRRAYLSVEPNKSHLVELRKTKEGFENSPQALLLVATRCMLDSAALCEHAKKEALESGILNQLKSVACENLAVLTGRRAGDFTDRTNSCMWFANMALACLERLTAADAANCLSLVTASVDFSRGKRTGFPAVPLSCVSLVRNQQLMANRATQICVETCLQLLMNLTHSSSGSAIVADHKGIEALTEIVWHLSTTSKDAGSSGANGKSQKKCTDDKVPDKLPETQDLLAGVSGLLNGSEDVVNMSVSSARKYHRQVTSALCVLSNMVEHHAPAAPCIASAHVQALPDSVASQKAAGNQCSGPFGVKGDPGVLTEVTEGEQSNQGPPDSENESRKPPSKVARLAAGSRRRRVKDDKRCPSSQHTSSQPSSSQVTASRSPSKATDIDSQAMSAPVPERKLGTFILKCCELLKLVREDSNSESQDEESSNLVFLKLYLAIFLGVVVHGCPEVRDQIAAVIDIVHVVEDMESGLRFYATHGAIEESSEKFLRSAIDSLKR